jgi:hypothetical protein
MRGHRIAVVGLAAVAVAACGGDDDGGTTASTTVATAGSSTSLAASTTSGASVTSSSPSTTSEPGGGGDDEIDSVQWGPDDPPIPGEYSAFAADGAGSLACDSIDDRAEGDDFWTLAAGVCRVFTGGAWPDVGSVPKPPAEGNPYERCLDGELYEMLTRALAWRDEHPGESPVVRYPASGTHSPCQTTLYDVRTTDASTDDGCANDETLPVPTPGVPVSISAPGILGYANPRATVNGALLCVIEDVEDNALRTFVVVVPTSGEGETVSIDVETNYGTLRADVELPATWLGTTEPAVVTTVATTPVVSTTITDTSDVAPATTDDP